MPDAGSAYRVFKRLMDQWGRGGLFLILISLMATGCATTAAPNREPALATAGGERPELMLRAEIQLWLGTPYRMGGMSHRGIDCSGLVVILYDDLFDMRLPRTTTALMRTGRWVKKKNLTAGDLVFFKPSTKFHHVGIYLGHGEFVHTSTSHGVMISRMNNDFWQHCYLTSRRLL